MRKNQELGCSSKIGVDDHFQPRLKLGSHLPAVKSPIGVNLDDGCRSDLDTGML
jgi:hypothetical protein